MIGTDIKDLLIKEERIAANATISVTELSGGTSSNVVLISSSDGLTCVLKKNQPDVIKEEAAFLEAYQPVNFLPTVLFKEARNKYMIYIFLPGTCNDLKREKQEMLLTLVKKVLNHLQPVTRSGWGWTEATSNSWGAFLEQEFSEVKRTLNAYLPEKDHLLVARLIEQIKHKPMRFQTYLLHGDCGVHNFIFQEGKLTGVIDPIPLIGEPLYDLIYAFCSSPEELTEDVILKASAELTVGSNLADIGLYEHILLGLYMRMNACIHHHPNDLKAYMQAWSYWVEKINKE